MQVKRTVLTAVVVALAAAPGASARVGAAIPLTVVGLGLAARPAYLRRRSHVGVA